MKSVGHRARGLSAVALAFTLIATLVVSVVSPLSGAEVAHAASVTAPTSPLPECVVDDGHTGLGCAPGGWNVTDTVGGSYSAGGTFTITTDIDGIPACVYYTDAGCHTELNRPSLIRCVFVEGEDATDIRSCPSLSSSGSVPATRVGSCEARFGNTYVHGGPTFDPSRWYNARAARAAACVHEVAGTPIDNLYGATFYLVRTSVLECVDVSGGRCTDVIPGSVERIAYDYAWLPVDGTLAPRAYFEPLPVSTPGNYVFDNKSVPFSEGTTDFAWEFGDGTTSTASDPGHTYTEAGNYWVRLTMTGSEGRTLTHTVSVLVEEIALTVAVADPEARFGDGETGNRYQIGDEFDVDVRVSTNFGLGDLTEVAPVEVEDLFDTVPPELEVVNLPSLERFPISMTHSESTTITARVKAVGSGRFSLASSWAGQRSAGDISTATGTLEGAVTGVDVTIELDPARVDKEDHDDEEPVDVNLKVTLANVSDGSLTNVSLRSLGLDRTVVGQAVDFEFVETERDPGTPVDPVVAEVDVVPPFDSVSGLSLPNIPEGKAIVVYAKVTVNDDGVFKVSAQVQAAAVGGDTVSGVGEERLVIDPEFYLEVDTNVQRPTLGELLPAGQAIRVEGTITNVTTTATIKVGTMYAELDGNAGAQVSTWNPTGPPSEVPSPIEPVELGPGESIDFLTRVVTGSSDARPEGEVRRSGGTRAYVTFTPYGIATLENGDQLDVVGDLVDIDEDEREYTISIDDRIAIPELDSLALAGGIFVGTLEGAVNSVIALVKGVIEAPELIYNALRATAEYQAKVWDSFTDEERDLFAEETSFLVVSVLLRNIEFAKEDLPRLYDQVDSYVGRMMTDLATEWETGNYVETAQAYSAAGGEAIGSIALPMALTKLVKSPQAVAYLQRHQAAKQAKLASVSDDIARVAQLEDATQLLQIIEAGVELTATQLSKLYGIGPDDAAELLRLAEKYNLLLTVRSRHATSLKWIKFFGAMFKPEPIKIKSVSDLDVRLGYPEDKLGSLVFRKPVVLTLSDSIPMDARIDLFIRSKGFAPGSPDYENAFSRVLQRVDEWKEYETIYKQYARRGFIETTFDYESNNAAISNISTDKKFTGFKMRKTSGPDDPVETYTLLLLDSKRGKYVPITGDIDPIAFTHLDGSPISSVLHKELLDEMIKSPLLRAIHGETATFQKVIKDASGAIVKRIEGLSIIAKQFKPGEAAVQFAPGQLPRTVRFVEEKSRWDSAFDFDLHWDGGFVHASAPRVTQAQSVDRGVTLIDGKAPVPAPTIPSVGVPKPPAASSGPNFGRCRIAEPPSSPPDAAFYVDQVGDLVRVTASGAVTSQADVSAQCFSEGSGVVDVDSGAVSTVAGDGDTGSFTSSSLAIGSDILPVVSPNDFRAGDHLVIGSGEPNMELRKVVEVGDELLLDEPLAVSHESGEIVAVVGRTDVVPSSSSLYPLTPARVLETRSGEVTVDGEFEAVGRLGAGSVTPVQIGGRGGVAVDAAAVAVNVTAIRPDGVGFVTLFPCGGEQPLTSSLNYGQGGVAGNSGIVKLSGDGELCVFTRAETDLVIDVNAWLAEAPSFESLTPARLAETRAGEVTVDGEAEELGRLDAGSVTKVQIAGRGGVAAGADAVALNVTAIRPSGVGYVTLYPCDEDRPTTSSLNFGGGGAVGNSAVVSLAEDGSLCVFTFADTDLVLDVNAWLADDASFDPFVPARFFETRVGEETVDGDGNGVGRLDAKSVTPIQVAGRGDVPADASAVALNVTAVRPAGVGFITLFPCDGDQPLTSSLNYAQGGAVGNSGVVKLAADGTVCAFTQADTDLVIDVNAAWTA